MFFDDGLDRKLFKQLFPLWEPCGLPCHIPFAPFSTFSAPIFAPVKAMRVSAGKIGNVFTDGSVALSGPEFSAVISNFSFLRSGRDDELPPVLKRVPACW